MAEEYHGHDGIRSFWEMFWAAWADSSAPIERLIDVGDDRVVALFRLQGRGLESGAVVDHPIAYIITLRDGLIQRIESYWDQDDALRTAGLSPTKTRLGHKATTVLERIVRRGR
jgi:ketosteroid isomerase-like protein